MPKILLLATLPALLALAALASPVTALAQGRGYQVEVIAFNHVAPNTSGELFFPPDEGASDWSDALLLWSDAAVSGDDYFSLADEAMRMGHHVRRLQQSTEYRPVSHLAWRQPAVSDPQMVRFQVASAECGERPLLDGVMRVRNLGELVFEFDLRYRDCTADPLSGKDALFRINGTPEVLFSRVYYFDHPLLGLLLEVRRDQ
ncbi:MAG: CsiV family protein [Candidatus Porifericomitaceae bacterium WSBS_2022_MAG_OTU9]